MAVDPRLIAVITEEAPAVIALVQSLFKTRHPDEPQPTSEDVIAAWEATYNTSLARDEQLLRDNPNEG